MTGATILVVEDDADINDAVCLGLKQAGLTTISAVNVHDALIAIADEAPDLALVDWMLPGRNGIELVRSIRRDETTSDMPIIMLTAKSTDENKIQAFIEGVDDYVAKPFSIRELTLRIKAVLRRVKNETDGATPIEVYDLKFDPISHRVSVEDTQINIGPTEFRLLKLFLVNQERVFTRDQIQNSVWGANSYLEDRTIDVHIRRLRKALSSVESKINYAALVQTVHGVGYRFSTRIPKLQLSDPARNG